VNLILINGYLSIDILYQRQDGLLVVSGRRRSSEPAAGRLFKSPSTAAPKPGAMTHS